MREWHELEAALARQIRGERLAHVHRVVETAQPLGQRLGLNPQQVHVAALMHDYAKAMKPEALLAAARQRGLVTDPAEEAQPHLLHGPVAAALLAEEGLVTDREVLAAIRYHTTGRAGMSPLEKVIWLADYLEPGRQFPGVDGLRALAEQNVDQALLEALNQTIIYVIGRGWPLHLDSVRARNGLLTTI